MPPDREPWLKLKIGIRRSGKMAALPSDSARLGYLYTLVEAKVQRCMGVFDNRGHFDEVLGRFGRYLDAYVAVGLLHEAPSLCPGCLERHPDARPGQLVVHDFVREQRDPTNAQRQADWRDRHRNGERDGVVTPSVTGPTRPGDADRNGVRNAEGNGVRNGTVTPDSRARRTTATATGTTRGLTRPSSSGGARAGGPVDPAEEDVPAWMEAKP